MCKLSLVIKNVDAQATEEQIKEYFSQFGEVHGVKMMPEAFTCFVSFKDREGARIAKEACGQYQFMGKYLYANYFEPKESR